MHDSCSHLTNLSMIIGLSDWLVMLSNWSADDKMGLCGDIERGRGAVTVAWFGFMVDDIPPSEEEDVRALLLHSLPLLPLHLLLHPSRWHLLFLHYAPRLLSLPRRSLPSLLTVQEPSSRAFLSSPSQRHCGAQLLQEPRSGWYAAVIWNLWLSHVSLNLISGWLEQIWSTIRQASSS